MKKKTNKKSSSKLWGGRFQEKQSDLMERIGESISFDKALYKQDISGSKAHAKMLTKIGVLTDKENQAIQKGLLQVKKEIESGKMEYRRDLEDIHMHIESRLTEIIGEPGKKLHTGRSRNDQVSQDVRLYLMDTIKLVYMEIFSLLEVILDKAKKSKAILFPGYTHMQVAQPIYASHWLLAHFWAFLRDLEFFYNAHITCDVLVLGSGALAGVNYPTDREFLKNELNLGRISENSMDAVSQRDHILQFQMAASQCMVHASRISEELVLYSSTEFSYIQLPDRLTSGSSIMPQKKNPDVAELIRGKSGIVIGDLMSVLTLVKGTPMSYNRDFQEDKPPLFRTADHLLLSLEGLKEMMEGLEFRPERIKDTLERGFATATDLADWLVSAKNLPFRESHEIVGKLVSVCVDKGKDLFTIDEESKKLVSPLLLDNDYKKAISLENSADKKDVYGGTAQKRQKEQIIKATKELNLWKKKCGYKTNS